MHLHILSVHRMWMMHVYVQLNPWDVLTVAHPEGTDGVVHVSDGVRSHHSTNSRNTHGWYRCRQSSSSNPLRSVTTNRGQST